jgi:ribosomal protein S18 acetylase RimI-like enzyme
MINIEIQIHSYSPERFEDTKALWRETFPDDPPWNAAEVAIPEKLAIQPDLFLVAVHRDKVVGSIMAGYDGHRGWLYMLAVLSAYRRRGIGSALVHEAERRLRALGCSKINLQVRTSNAAVVGFYERLGYATEERVSMGKRSTASATR